MNNKPKHDSLNEPKSVFKEVQEVNDPPPGGNGGGGRVSLNDPPPGGNGGGGRGSVNVFSQVDDDNSVTKR